jgi:hypothetical protein
MDKLINCMKSLLPSTDPKTSWKLKAKDDLLTIIKNILDSDFDDKNLRDLLQDLFKILNRNLLSKTIKESIIQKTQIIIIKLQQLDKKISSKICASKQRLSVVEIDVKPKLGQVNKNLSNGKIVANNQRLSTDEIDKDDELDHNNKNLGNGKICASKQRLSADDIDTEDELDHDIKNLNSKISANKQRTPVDEIDMDDELEHDNKNFNSGKISAGKQRMPADDIDNELEHDNKNLKSGKMSAGKQRMSTDEIDTDDELGNKLSIIQEKLDSQIDKYNKYTKEKPMLGISWNDTRQKWRCKHKKIDKYDDVLKNLSDLMLENMCIKNSENIGNLWLVNFINYKTKTILLYNSNTSPLFDILHIIDLVDIKGKYIYEKYDEFKDKITHHGFKQNKYGGYILKEFIPEDIGVV